MVTDHRQARLLTDPRSAAFIYPFLARERSTAEAAQEARCPITTVTYYRSSQEAYRVPLTATGFTDHRDRARRIGAPIYRRIIDAYSSALARTGSATRSITRDDHGGIYSTDLPPHRTRGRRPLLFEDRVVQLTLEQAEWLCAQLDRTLGELADTDRGDSTPGQAYAVMVAAVPLRD